MLRTPDPFFEFDAPPPKALPKLSEPKPLVNGGLTGLLIELMKATAAEVKAMNVDERAKHYGVSPKHVEGYRMLELENRGVRNG